MVLMTIEMDVLPPKRKELIQTLLGMMGDKGLAQGCLNCSIYQGIERANNLFLYTEWRDREVIDAYLRSDRFAALLGAMSLLREPPKFKLNTTEYTGGIEEIEAVREGLNN
jgi:quinol monooxygenase YgiN